MGRVLPPKFNFRVVIEPSAIYSFGDQDIMVRRCEEIVAEVRRHVDNVDSVRIEFDQDPVCEHCGYAWTEDSPTYNGGCCEKDQENAPVAAQGV